MYVYLMKSTIPICKAIFVQLTSTNKKFQLFIRAKRLLLYFLK